VANLTVGCRSIGNFPVNVQLYPRIYSLIVTLRYKSGDDLESFAFYMYIYSPVTGILLVVIGFPLISGCYLFRGYGFG
jgi:hypothetical protein